MRIADKHKIFRVVQKPVLGFAMLLLCLFISTIQTSAQGVITNTGAAITITDVAVVDGDTVNNLSGDLSNDGTINLQGGFINNDNVLGNGYYNIKGNWVNTSVFNPGFSTVQFYGNKNQWISSVGGGNFCNLIINNAGADPLNRIILLDDFQVTNRLIMSLGNVLTNANKLFLTNQLSASLQYNSVTGSRIIGRFERGISEAKNYLFPIGSALHYNPLNLGLNESPISGSIISHFFANDPGGDGLPIEDDSVEVYEQYPEGYWSLKSVGFSSSDFNLNVDAAGFSDLQDISRIIKRPAGGDWELDGTHSDMQGSLAFRENLIGDIAPTGTEFGIGRPRPLIMIQPQDTAVCEDDGASFYVKARGRRLTYQWQIWNGSDWENLDEEGVYEDVDKKEMFIFPTDLSMDGNQYRVVITDKNGNIKISDSATLTVNERAQAIATPASDTICDGQMIDIALTSNVPLSTFELIVIESGNISGATTILDGGNAIRHTLVNNSLAVDSVVYHVIASGPDPTYCEGEPARVVIYVNPSPRFEVNIQDTIYCDSSQIAFDISDLLGDIIGKKVYDLTTSFSAGDVLGVDAGGSNIVMETPVINDLVNTTREVQEVEYTFHYRINRNGAGDIPFCGGIDTTITIYLLPTPVFSVSVPSDTVCNETNVVFTLLDSLIAFDVNLEIEKVYDLFTDYDIGAVQGVEANTQNVPMGTVLDNQLINNSNIVQEVTYRFKYRLNDEREDGKPFCDHHIDTTIVISVNPTPNLSVLISNDLISSDTVFCNGYEVAFDWDNTQETTGDIKYHLFISGDVGIVNGETPSTSWDSLDIDFTNTLTHNDSEIKYLNYNFDPYIENAFGTTGCYSGMDTTVKVQIVPVFESDYFVDTLYGGNNVTCFGYDDGSITLDPVGGYYKDDYTFVWRDTFDVELQEGSGDQDILGDLSAGWYYYALEDVLGCKHDSLFEVKEPDKVRITNLFLNEPLCFGDGYLGSIELDVVGGVQPFDYKWKNRQTGELFYTEDLYNIGLDKYTFYAVDTNGCSIDTTYRLKPTDAFSASVVDSSNYGLFNISCNGAEDGRVVVNGNGGALPYQFVWYNEDLSPVGNTTPTIDNLGPGTYYYAVIDNNGCKTGEVPEDSIVAVVITEPDPITFRRETADKHAGDWDISCAGLSDGQINLQYMGGHTENPLLHRDFVWTESDGGSGIIDLTDSIQSGLSAGTYNVKVTDEIGCFNDTTIQLFEPVEISYRDSAKAWIGDSSIRCFGEANGETYLLDLYGGGSKADTGDTPGEYSYQWTSSNGHVFDDNSLMDQSELPAGWYKYKIMDKVNPLCYKEDSIHLSEPANLRADTLVDRLSDKNGFAVRCYGFNDGEIELIPYGGTAPYSYEWTGPEGILAGEEDEIITDLYVGTYSVKLIDINGCEINYDMELNSPDTMVLHPYSDFIECFGDTSSIYLSPSGGNVAITGAYQYTWEGELGESKYNNVAGKYYVELMDDNNCIVTDSLTLEQSTEIIPMIDIISLYNGRFISCEGDSDGAMEVNIIGGEPGYTYLWNRMGETDILSSDKQLLEISAGTYVVTGVDQFGCNYRDSLEIVEPQAMEIEDFVVDPRCHGASDGEISLYVSYGTPEYSYSWTGPIAPLSGNRVEKLIEGIYSVVVTDLNECEDSADFELIAPDILVMESDSEPAECKDESNGSITFGEIIGGTWPYKTMVNEVEILGGTYENLKPGIYTIHLIDNQGCNFYDTITVEMLSVSCLNPPNAFTPNGDGANDTWVLDEDDDGSNDLYLYPDAELRIYNRWGELVYYTSSVADQPWDGTYNGRDLPVDSYHFVLDLGTDDDVPIIGNVTIIK